MLSLASILPSPVRVRSTGDGHCSPSRTNGHHSTCTKARSIQSRSTHTSPTELVNDVTGHPLWDGRCIIDSDVVRQWLCWAYTLRQSPHCALTWELGSSEKNFLPVVFRTLWARHKRLSYGNIWLITHGTIWIITLFLGPSLCLVAFFDNDNKMKYTTNNRRWRAWLIFIVASACLMVVLSGFYDSPLGDAHSIVPAHHHGQRPMWPSGYTDC